MKTQRGARSPARFPPMGPISSSDSNVNVTADHRVRRRKIRRPGGAFRVGRSRSPSGRGSSLATPLLRWKFDDGEFRVGAGGDCVAGRKGGRRFKNGGEVKVSARRLATGMWRLSLVGKGSGSGHGGRGGGGEGGDMDCESYDRLGFEVSLS